eukprot:6631710-Pyramimonas_sp.AAC.1
MGHWTGIDASRRRGGDRATGEAIGNDDDPPAPSLESGPSCQLQRGGARVIIGLSNGICNANGAPRYIDDMRT